MDQKNLTLNNMKKLTPQEWLQLFPKKVRTIIPAIDFIQEHWVGSCTCLQFLLNAMDLVEPDTQEERDLDALCAFVAKYGDSKFDQFKL